MVPNNRGQHRGNPGSSGNREAQSKRLAEKRKLVRAKERAARSAAGDVVNKGGRRRTRSFEKLRLVGKQKPLGREASAIAARAQAQQARDLQK